MTNDELVAVARELADRIRFDIGVIYHDDSGHDKAFRFVESCVYPAVRKALTIARPAIRNAALEEAANTARQFEDQGYHECKVAAAIRALKTPEPPHA